MESFSNDLQTVLATAPVNNQSTRNHRVLQQCTPSDSG